MVMMAARDTRIVGTSAATLTRRARSPCAGSNGQAAQTLILMTVHHEATKNNRHEDATTLTARPLSYLRTLMSLLSFMPFVSFVLFVAS
jgi:hypothetical protein